MASTFTQSIFASTYKDDYRDSDNYHRILFNSGRALQARELTQMQTIIQSEIGRFGRNVFKEGASVNPGGPTIDANYEFVKLNTTVNNLPGGSIVGNIFTGQTSGLRAEIIEVVAAENSDPATLYVKYIGGVSGGVVTALRFTPSENITDGTNTLTVQTTNTTADPAVGQGVRFSCSSGDFFTRGHFVFTEAQSIILSKYDPNYTGVVGFKVVEDIITAADNSALYDNQGASPNITAPGADRYRIKLTLIDQSNVDSDEVFIYFAKIVNSIIVNNVTGTDEYNKINQILAKRTKEESGNYIVRPYILKFDEDSDNGYLIADVSAGISYINGHRVELPAPSKIRIPKPTSTSSFNNQAVAANYGNYVVVSTLKGTPLIGSLEKWDLRDATGYGGSTIGTARVRAVEEDGANYKVYITDVLMSGFNSFADVRSIGVSATTYGDLVLENSIAVLYDASNNDLLFPLPLERPQNLSDISLVVQKRFTTTNASGTATLGPGNLTTGETWADVNTWIVTVDSDGSNISSVVSVSGAGSTTATISGIPVGNGATIEVLAYVDKSAGTIITKTMNETTRTAAVESDGSGNKYVSLNKADVYDVLRIRDSDSDGIDLTNYFRFDNGQRDNFYGVGKLLLKSTFSAPTNNVFVRFKYFSHGAGDFFAVSSYDSATTGISYAEIPEHTLTDGTIISLRDYLDFRPRIGDLGTGFDSATASVRPLPRNTDIIRADVNYYHPRYDKLVLTETGVLTFIPGTEALTPNYPETPVNSLELYKVRFNPNTLNDSDVGITALDYKRYTMADIGKLEKRIDRLEEYTTLSLLEVETSVWSIVDSTGIPRTKAGFLADGFADHYFSDTVSPEYRAAIDPKQKIVRPSVVSHNIRLKYDSNQSSNVVLKGDNVYLAFTDSEYITQTFVTTTENINPFHVVTNIGVIELSPASDEWKETSYIAPRVIDGGIRLDADQARLFNEWQWEWQGIVDQSADLTGTVLASSTRRRRISTTTSTVTGGGTTTTTTTTTRRIRTTVDRVVSDETVREVIGDRIVDIAVIPFMRSRKVHFRAFGLKPFQRYFAYFDDVDVSNWVREEPFVRFATTSDDVGNTLNNAVAHPDGATNLETDSSGSIEGSFIIPSTPDLRFRTGSRELKFLNVNSPVEENATSFARGLYTANGVLETRQQDILSTREIVVRGSTRTRRRTSTSVTVVQDPQPPVEPVVDPARPRKRLDPLAQTFFVDAENGVFLTKVAVYFKTKPSGAQNPSPVALEIRPVVNGYPSSLGVVPGSTVVKTPSEIAIAATQTQSGVLESPTFFEFEEPIYLSGFVEYCIVLLTDSVDYNVYVSQIDQFVLGSTESRVGQQPSLGSLFKSQNASTWEPDQTKDLTFKLYRAKFTSNSGYAILENVDVPLKLLEADPIQFDSGSRWATIYHPNHGFDSGDTVKIYGLDSASTYGGVLGTSILGANTVSFPDATGYQIYMDSTATSSVFDGGSNVKATQNLMYDIINPHIDVLTTPNTNVYFESKLTTGRSLAGTETRFIKDTTFNPISVKEDNYGEAPFMIGHPDVEAAAPLNGSRSATIKISLTSSDSNTSPVIDMQRASLILINNLIDKQDSDRSVAGFNTPISFVNETDPVDGTHVAKHITVPVALAENATGLQIVLSANRPADADFLVYYRTATSGENIRTKNYTYVAQEVPVPSDDNPEIYREYRYLVGGRNGTMTPFTQYQLKIVFRSTNSSKVPSITDLRVIALAD